MLIKELFGLKEEAPVEKAEKAEDTTSVIVVVKGDETIGYYNSGKELASDIDGATKFDTIADAKQKANEMNEADEQETGTKFIAKEIK